jgi:endonuclease/exonuclease/phosphatase (EEP) superfamily protein YafD
VATATLAVSLLLSVCRIFTPSPRPWVLATAFVPYAAAGYLFALLVTAAALRRASPRRRTWLAATAVVATSGLVFHLGLLLPLYLGRAAGGHPDLTVMTANLRLGQADPRAVVRLVREQHVDVLVLEELTTTEADGLVAAGLLDVLPHVAGGPGGGPTGTAVVSRFALDSPSALATRNRGLSMRVEAPKPFWLVAIHPSQPLHRGGGWNDDWAVVDKTLATLDGPRLLVGDFNSTLDHGPVRTALQGGLHDAAVQANSGWQPTWPSTVEPYRLPWGFGLFAIDHVLASRQFDALTTRTFAITGTDHEALLARLAGP